MFYSETLPKSSRSAGRARELLDRLRGELPPSTVDDARLLVSELVANAVEHVAEEGDIELRVALREGVLRVEVLDPGPGFEYKPRPEGASSERGWGLHFTATVSTRWAIERGERTCVWFELDGLTGS